ncbi:MAG: flavodoxin family protein [Clostridia bacterium]|nr:flavodoxin family protein [Clostridia bacterium]
MNKVIVLNASPKKNGFTSQLTEIFLSEYRSEIHIYNMYDEKIAPCTGCDYCITEKKCRMNDTDAIISDIFSADFVIFASPVYNYSFPAPMKAFLDRLQPLFMQEKTASDRKGFLLASCGKSGKFSIEVMEKQSRMAFSELNTEFCGSFFFTETDKRSTLQNDEICKVKALAKEFFNTAF